MNSRSDAWCRWARKLPPLLKSKSCSGFATYNVWTILEHLKSYLTENPKDKGFERNQTNAGRIQWTKIMHHCSFRLSKTRNFWLNILKSKARNGLKKATFPQSNQPEPAEVFKVVALDVCTRGAKITHCLWKELIDDRCNRWQMGVCYLVWWHILRLLLYLFDYLLDFYRLLSPLVLFGILWNCAPKTSHYQISSTNNSCFQV